MAAKVERLRRIRTVVSSVSDRYFCPSCDLIGLGFAPHWLPHLLSSGRICCQPHTTQPPHCPDIPLFAFLPRMPLVALSLRLVSTRTPLTCLRPTSIYPPFRPLLSRSLSSTMASSAPARQTVTYGNKQVQIFASSKDLEAALGPYITSIATNAVQQRGKFTVAFSGGSLPASVGSALSAPAEALTLAPTVHQWHVFFADERLVDLQDKESNYAGVKQNFLSKFPSLPAANVHTLNTALLSSPTEAAADYQRQLLSVTDDGTLDLVLLGMGPDGHTCSLFPSHPLLNERELLVSSLTDSPKPPPQRITLTLPAVNKARHAVFVLQGDEKAQSLHEALEVPDRGLPAGRVESINTAFFVDEKAAAKLNKAKL